MRIRNPDFRPLKIRVFIYHFMARKKGIKLIFPLFFCVGSGIRDLRSEIRDLEKTSRIRNTKYLVANATILDILFHRLVPVLRRVHFTYRVILLWGSHGGVDVKCVLFVWSCIDVIVVRVKVSRGIIPFALMWIDSADQPPNEAVCMDKSYLFPNNPARQ